MLRFVLASILTACIARAASPVPVHAWQDSLSLPTYLERDPDPIPQFAAFHTDGAANYPYPIRSGISIDPKDRSNVAWRTLNLENEYLLCRILPDLGGHVYNCRDKIANREIFYANPVIKKDMVGQRGAWIATGIEPNFPVTHSRLTASPVNFAIRNEAGGSASVIVSDTDRVTGMQWRVEYRLRPGIAALEERVTLYNPTVVRKPYYWWNNAAIEWDDPGVRYIFPTKLVVSHGGTTLETWPVNSAGVDVSVVANDKTESAWFAYHSNEPFMAIYKPKSKTGVAHYADASVLPGKKMWIMGQDQIDSYKHRWSDNSNLHIEMQAGLFTGQETSEFLEPQQARSFTEYWIPFRELSGITRVTPSVILYAARKGSNVAVELGATRTIAGARIRILQQGKAISETVADLDPKQIRTVAPIPLAAGPFRIEVADSKGALLLDHTEGVYDAVVPPGTKTGPQKRIDWNGPETEWLLAKRENFNESSSMPKFARNDFSVGMSRFPRNLAFGQAAARISLAFSRFDDAAKYASGVLARTPVDNEAFYYAGAAQSGLGHDTAARALLSRVSLGSRFGEGATFELALLSARAHDFDKALAFLEPLSSEPGRAAHIGAIQVALLRRSGKKTEALDQFHRVQFFAPDEPLLRHEGSLLGVADPGLWPYLAGDAERLLDVVDDYFRLGMWDDALGLLKHDFLKEDPGFLEPGAVPPQKSALVAYYRAFAESILKIDSSEDLRVASTMGARYIFPTRASSIAVLNTAIARDGSDATAHALLANLDIYSFRLDSAANELKKAIAVDPSLETQKKLLAQVLAAMKEAPPAPVESAKAAPAVEPAKVARKVASPTPAASPAPIAIPDGKTAAEKARSALLTAASAPDTALAMFRGSAFADEKQPPEVRQAYIEAQLQAILVLSETGKCDAEQAALFTLGNEDSSLPFTLYGFGPFMAAPHFQYYMGVAEANCNRMKEARKYWAKIAKAKIPASSPEFGYPFLAAARLDPAGAKAPATQALKALDAAGGDASVRKLHQGILQRAVGQEGEAVVSLSETVQASRDPMVQYLAAVELSRKAPPLHP